MVRLTKKVHNGHYLELKEDNRVTQCWVDTREDVFGEVVEWSDIDPDELVRAPITDDQTKVLEALKTQHSKERAPKPKKGQTSTPREKSTKRETYLKYCEMIKPFVEQLLLTDSSLSQIASYLTILGFTSCWGDMLTGAHIHHIAKTMKLKRSPRIRGKNGRTYKTTDKRRNQTTNG